MTLLIDCPHCSTRVLPMAGRICPACRRDVDAPPRTEPPAEEVSAAYHLAAEQFRRGTGPAGVERILTRRGIDPQTAAAVVGDMERNREQTPGSVGSRNMLLGALWCGGGIAYTALTYQSAANSGGETFFVAWGAVLFGGLQFCRGLFQSAGR